MSRAIGTILLLYAVSHVFNEAVDSFEAATVATFATIETAAEVSEAALIEPRTK